MPRQHTGIHSVYIADGFADDCDELIHRCSSVSILNYQAFCKFFKELNFASLYKGRTSNAEIAELSEEVLQIAKYYMVLGTSNYESNVAGLFLVYALLNLQPYPGFAALRITPEDVPALLRIDEQARRGNRLDVLYVLGSLLVKGPVCYHAEARERGLEASLRKYLEGTSILDITGVRPKGVYFRQTAELTILSEMIALYNKYSHVKSSMTKTMKTHGNYITETLANDLGRTLKGVINGTGDPEGELKDHYSCVQDIKRRAMQSTVGGLKHLETAESRSPEKNATPSTSKSSEKPSPKQKRKRRRNYSSSSSDDEDYEYSPEEEGRVKKPYVSRASRSLIEETEEDPVTLSDEEIDLMNLPSLMTTESDGKVIEIEIIDEMKKLEVTAAKGKSRKTKGRTDDEIFKKPMKLSPRLRVATRRDMKQPIRKSKFKKLGMLDIAGLSAKEKPSCSTATTTTADEPSTVKRTYQKRKTVPS